MSIYGSVLWNYDKTGITERLNVAWGKCMKRLLDIPYTTKSLIIPAIVNDVPPNR